MDTSHYSPSSTVTSIHAPVQSRTVESGCDSRGFIEVDVSKILQAKPSKDRRYTNYLHLYLFVRICFDFSLVYVLTVFSQMGQNYV